MIAQCKGKDLHKIPKSKLYEDGWYPSIKYDGNNVQIEKKGNTVRFWTSGGKEFYIDGIAKDLIEANPGVDFDVETEYIGLTDGRLGSRDSCSTAHFRANFKKGLRNDARYDNVRFMVFDILTYKDDSISVGIDDKLQFKDKVSLLRKVKYTKGIQLADLYWKTFNLKDIDAQSYIDRGWEGLIIKHETHVCEPGKRVNTIAKIKNLPTADLLCIGVEEGEGKCNGIGALVLKDSEGRIVNVGSGLDYAGDTRDGSKFIGKVIEIQYERIAKTYIQPVFKSIREDKTEEDIT